MENYTVYFEQGGETHSPQSGTRCSSTLWCRNDWLHLRPRADTCIDARAHILGSEVCVRTMRRDWMELDGGGEVGGGEGGGGKGEEGGERCVVGWRGERARVSETQRAERGRYLVNNEISRKKSSCTEKKSEKGSWSRVSPVVSVVLWVLTVLNMLRCVCVSHSINSPIAHEHWNMSHVLPQKPPLRQPSSLSLQGKCLCHQSLDRSGYKFLPVLPFLQVSAVHSPVDRKKSALTKLRTIKHLKLFRKHSENITIRLFMTIVVCVWILK